MAEEVGKFGEEIIAKNIPNMSKKEILDSLLLNGNTQNTMVLFMLEILVETSE
ncbi:hypothetical protein [Bacillus atrophaeus]|uniref:hypothetical protein n=1 Tax=Bacillus atrophaeus TaxID=1452 RepID=UPI0021592366|nr:hypothetical protein [Bacillus atrophaeus]